MGEDRSAKHEGAPVSRMLPKPASIKVRALQWLAQREHSRAELRGKLLRLLRAGARAAAAADDDLADNTAESAGVVAEVDTLLDWLEAHGYLSHARFIESRVHARQARFGNLRIRRELQQHGVALDPAAQQALKDSEFDRAREVWRRKYGAAPPAADAAARVRQMRFLTGRGFSSDVIRRVLRDTGSGVDD